MGSGWARGWTVGAEGVRGGGKAHCVQVSGAVPWCSPCSCLTTASCFSLCCCSWEICCSNSTTKPFTVS